MGAWIDLGALWRIALLGVLAGAGLPALFAVGVRAWYGWAAPPVADQEPSSDAIAEGEDVRRAPSAAGAAVAVACFAVVLAAVVWGIWSIVGRR